MRVFWLILFLVPHYSSRDWWLLDRGLLSLYGHFYFSFGYNVLQHRDNDILFSLLRTWLWKRGELSQTEHRMVPHPLMGHKASCRVWRDHRVQGLIHTAVGWKAISQAQREMYFPDAYLKAGRKACSFFIFRGDFVGYDGAVTTPCR